MSTAECKEEAIFAAARRIADSAARNEYLQEVCGDDSVLRNRVSALLRVLTEDRDFLESPLATSEVTTALMAEMEGVGILLGPYRLLEQIGTGGMGLVFLAEQQQPVKRLVAVKIIKPGIDTRDVIARFEVERQALAMMDHPNIARMLDTGTTGTGRPYFVMELVRGIPVTDFCDKFRLSINNRLRLFAAVCDGVQHAHLKGIIHRDIKPANVLIPTDRDSAAAPVPKVIDFGIAKATNCALSEWTLHTDVLQLIGTPSYMSPEQTRSNNQDVDTRSDIYSLGVLLYQLLTGSCPFDRDRLRSAGYDEMCRIIRDEDPPRPSVRVAQQETLRNVSPLPDQIFNDRQFSRTLRNELDWIVMKALEKEPARRYQTTGELADDIRRFLGNEPIEARPPSTLYRLRKFARRRRSLSALLAMSFGFLLVSGIALVIGVAAVTHEKNEVVRQRDLAEAAHRKVLVREETIRDFLYAADLQLAYQAYFRGDVQQAAQKLQEPNAESVASENRGFEWHYLQRLCESTSLTLKGHTGNVFGVEFSPDGKWLASSSGDATLKIWNTSDWTLKLTLRDFTSDVNAASFNRDGTLLATAEESGIARVWNVNTGEEVARFTDFTLPVGRVFFTADENILVATEVEWNNLDARTSTWDLTTKKRIKRLDHCRMLAVNSEGSKLAAVDRVGKPSVWSLPELNLVASSPELQPEAICARFSNDGNFLAFGTRKADVRIWAADLSEWKSLPRFTADPSAVRDVVFTPDGQFLIVGTDNGTVWTWELASQTVQKVFRPASGPVWSVAVSPSGSTEIFGCDGGTIVANHRENVGSHRKSLLKLQEPLINAAVNASHTVAGLIRLKSGDVVLAETSSGKVLKTLQLTDGAQPKSVRFSTISETVWVGDNVGRIHEFDLATGECLRELKICDNAIDWMANSPSGALVAVRVGQPSDFSGVIWDLPAGRRVRLIPGNADPTSRQQIFGFIDEQHLLASRARETLILDVNSESPQQIPLPSDNKWTTFSAASPDGRRIAIGTADAPIYLIDREDFSRTTTLFGHRSGIVFLTFSADGRTLASAGEDGEARLWHVPTAQPICELQGLSSYVHLLQFTADGRRLIAVANNSDGGSQLLIWDANAPIP